MVEKPTILEKMTSSSDSDSSEIRAEPVIRDKEGHLVVVRASLIYLTFI
jgi:hypothetical protein